MTEKNRPIVEALQRFFKQQHYSFHVPGHKHGELSQLPDDFRNVMQYDLTELTGLDDFHYPEDVILQAEELLQQTYKTDKSYFLINGSTVGNLAMIYAVCQYGDEVIVQRNAHKSIFHGLELVGAKPIYITPEWDEYTKTATHITLSTLDAALMKYPKVKAVILTYPTYYGVINNELSHIIELCHTKSIPVLVDEAHGAHFMAYNQFPKSALFYGADIVVQSAHKTLPAMTMASFMHVKSKFIQVKQVNKYLRMLQTSSPSYLLLASLDDARHYVQNYLEVDAVYFLQKRRQWIDSLKSINDLEVIEVDDPLKISLRVKGYSGFTFKSVLERHKIYVELADAYQVLLILPLIKQHHIYPFADIRIKIKEAIAQLKSKQQDDVVLNIQKIQDATYKISQSPYSFEQMNKMERQWIPYMRAIGRTSAEMIIPYPPGIPLLLPGEKITVAKLKQLEDFLAVGVVFQGNHRLQEKSICVFTQSVEENHV